MNPVSALNITNTEQKRAPFSQSQFSTLWASHYILHAQNYIDSGSVVSM